MIVFNEKRCAEYLLRYPLQQSPHLRVGNIAPGSSSFKRAQVDQKEPFNDLLESLAWAMILAPKSVKTSTSWLTIEDMISTLPVVRIW